MVNNTLTWLADFIDAMALVIGVWGWFEWTTFGCAVIVAVAAPVLFLSQSKKHLATK